MFRSVQLLFVLLVACPALADDKLPLAPRPRVAAKKVAATIESNLATGHHQVRQFAFDDDPSTYFESEKNPTTSDHLSVVLDNAVSIAGIQVLTGKPDGTGSLTAGVIEVSLDGKRFETVAKFDDKGSATAKLKNKMVKVIRIRPTQSLDHPLIVREVMVDSKPRLVTFKYPVEFELDVADAPEMKEWAEKSARICERQYSSICEELMSPGFKPLAVIHMALKNDYNGVAAAGGDRITGSVKYFKAHPDDFGAMVHETTHCIQRYRSRRNPGWLVEGVADYIRFFRYEPGKIGRLNSDRAQYDGSYRTTAAFLNFVAEKYDPHLVAKLNCAMREGTYDEAIWKELTGKKPEELNQEWRRSLVR